MCSYRVCFTEDVLILLVKRAERLVNQLHNADYLLRSDKSRGGHEGRPGQYIARKISGVLAMLDSGEQTSPALIGIASMLFVRNPVFLSCSWLNLSSE